MINFLKKKFLDFFFLRKVIKLNKKIFKKKKLENKKIILVEFNAYHNFHAASSILINYFKNKHNYETHAFFNNSMLSAALKFNLINKIKWELGNLLSLKNFGLYRSFGVKKIFRHKNK